MAFLIGDIMDLIQAQVIAELLCGNGWLDDYDELLAGLADDQGKEAAVAKAAAVDSLVETINAFLPEEERIRPPHRSHSLKEWAETYLE